LYGVSNFFTKVNYPVLTDLQIDMGGAKTDLIYPRSIPDVFRGSQVTLIGRYSNAASLDAISLRLTGKSSGQSRSFTYDKLSFPLRAEANDYLPRLWATRRVGWLMEQVRTNGEQKELRDEIDLILARNRNEVTKILDQYGVPRVGNVEEKVPGIAVPGLGAAHTRVE